MRLFAISFISIVLLVGCNPEGSEPDNSDNVDISVEIPNPTYKITEDNYLHVLGATIWPSV